MENFLTSLISFATAGAIFTWFGKFIIEKTIDHKLKEKLAEINLVKSSDLEFKKDQIKHLYGPLYGILKANRKIYDLWINGKLKEINLKTKQRFKENNAIAKSIITNNAHLIDENPMPEHFIRFVTSSEIWSMYCADHEEGSLPEHLSEHPDVEYCKEFENYIIKKYEALSKELEEMYNKYRIKI